ncbi:MAG: hypothetical protein WB792_12105 [Desulfobacterales bacterium]
MVVGLLAVLLAALFPPLKPPRNRRETLEQLEEMPRQRQFEKMSHIALGIVFWIVLCVLIWAVIANYLK